MNREIVGGGGAIVYPLTGDVTSTAGNPSVTVTGIQNIPVVASFPTDKEILTYDGPSNTLSLQNPVKQITLETNGTPNSTQVLLNIAAGTNVTITEVAGTVTINGTSPLALKTNGVANSSQTLLNLVAGTNMTITESAGAVTFVANGSGATRGVLNTNANGNWYVWSDGIVESWGSVSIVPTTTSHATGLITFPLAYTTSVTGISAVVLGIPRAGSTDAPVVSFASLSTTTAGIDLQCAVPTGGGGVTFDQTVQVFWRAIGK